MEMKSYTSILRSLQIPTAYSRKVWSNNDILQSSLSSCIVGKRKIHPLMNQRISIPPPILSDTLGGILHHLPLISDHLTLRLVCSSLARDVCIESCLINFGLKTVDQVNALNLSPSVGEKCLLRVHLIPTFEEMGVLRALPIYVTSLNCSFCEQLTNGCFDALVNITPLVVLICWGI